VYNQLNKEFPDLKLSKWSGVGEDEPGDLLLSNILIECKRFRHASDNLIQEWMNKDAVFEAEQLNKIPVVIFRLDRQKSKFIFRLKDLGLQLDGNCITDWDTGVVILRRLSLNSILPLK
jgi:hypothetical protein